MLPKVDIILLNFNGLKVTPTCITTLYKKASYPFHLIVVDNVSVDGSREWLQQNEKRIPNLTVHYNEKPDGGYSAGNNVGLKYVRDDCKYVVLLNNDTLIFQYDWLTRMVEEMEADPKIGVQGIKLLYPNDLIQHAGVTYALTPEGKEMVPFHIGRFEKREKFSYKIFLPAVTFACVMIRRELLKDGLDEVYGAGNYEDIDFCCMVRKLGYKILYNGEVEIYHYEGHTNLSRPNQVEWNKHIHKNWLLLNERWGAWLKEDVKKTPDLYQAGLDMTHETVKFPII